MEVFSTFQLAVAFLQTEQIFSFISEFLIFDLFHVYSFASCKTVPTRNKIQKIHNTQLRLILNGSLKCDVIYSGALFGL